MPFTVSKVHSEYKEVDVVVRGCMRVLVLVVDGAVFVKGYSSPLHSSATPTQCPVSNRKRVPA